MDAATAEVRAEALQWAILQQPHSAKTWLELVAAVDALPHPSATARVNAVSVVYERALRAVPQSFKLWMRYLRFREHDTAGLCGPHEWLHSLRELYTRALTSLPRMPWLWTHYLELLTRDVGLTRVTMVRHVLLDALAALPVTQHGVLWRVVRTWTRRRELPHATVRALWAAYVCFDPTPATHRAYLRLLRDRDDLDGFVQHCLSLCGPDAVHPVLHEMTVWDDLVRVLQSPNWVLTTADPAALRRLAAAGERYAASRDDFCTAWGLFRAGQGDFAAAREELTRLLERATGATRLQRGYAVAAEMEGAACETVLLRGLTQDAVYAAVFGITGTNDAPLHPLRSLCARYALWVNQSQLRETPQSARLWLKRVELAEESSTAVTTRDVIALYRQALTQCTAGLAVVDDAVGALYERLSHTLLRCGEVEEATAVLRDAAWATPFGSIAVNVHLLGRLCELWLMTTPTPAHTVLRRLSATPSTRAGVVMMMNRGRNGPDLAHDSRAWLLAWDVCRAVGSEARAAWLSHYTAHSCADVETLCAVGWGCFIDGAESQSRAAMERVLGLVTRAELAPGAAVFGLGQYVAALLARPTGATLRQVRDVAEVLREVARRAVGVAPVTTMDTMLGVVALEARLGLRDRAVRELHTFTRLALRGVRCTQRVRLLAGLLQTCIDFTLHGDGVEAVRELCAGLLHDCDHPVLVQRTALHWAAIERRSGHAAAAHTVLDACAESQDPSTPHGALYWRLWESACESVADFARVAQRRQQVEVHWARTPHPRRRPRSEDAHDPSHEPEAVPSTV